MKQKRKKETNIVSWKALLEISKVANLVQILMMHVERSKGTCRLVSLSFNCFADPVLVVNIELII